MSKLVCLWLVQIVVFMVVLQPQTCLSKKQTKKCSHNGVEYKEGKKIPMDSPCLKCKCRKGKVQCDSPKKCRKVDCPVPVINPGECCPRCVCKDSEGNTYKRFQNWSYMKGEVCYECECKKRGIAECEARQCKESCPAGYNGVKTAGFCCPVCTHVLSTTKRPPPKKFSSWEELNQYIAGNVIRDLS